jgi:hypothetical protein
MLESRRISLDECVDLRFAHLGAKMQDGLVVEVFSSHVKETPVVTLPPRSCYKEAKKEEEHWRARLEGMPALQVEYCEANGDKEERALDDCSVDDSGNVKGVRRVFQGSYPIGSVRVWVNPSVWNLDGRRAIGTLGATFVFALALMLVGGVIMLIRVGRHERAYRALIAFTKRLNHDAGTHWMKVERAVRKEADGTQQIIGKEASYDGSEEGQQRSNSNGCLENIEEGEGALHSLRYIKELVSLHGGAHPEKQLHDLVKVRCQIIREKDPDGSSLSANFLEVVERARADLSERFPRRRFLPVEKKGSKRREAFKVYAYSYHIQLVVENLLINAAKHSRKDTDVKTKMLRDKDMVRLEVLNEGEHISRSDAKRIFRLGVRLNNRQDSSGYGLFFVKQATTGMGGNVWVEMVEDPKGVRFVVTVPAVEQREDDDKEIEEYSTS